MHHRLLKILSDVSLLNITLPILMIYLIIGTLAQKYIGLYEATQNFFYSPIFWIGMIPLPGMPVFMVLLALNLGCYIFLKNPWKPEKIGTLISHIGILLLLTGGLYTAVFSKAGYIDLAIGETQSNIFDYHQRSFIIRNTKTNQAFNFNHDGLKKIKSDAVPFTIDVMTSCKNCNIIKRQDKDKTFFGMAQHMALTPKKLDLQNEENMAGLSFTVQGSENDGTYLILEGLPQYPEVTANGETYRFELNKATRVMPFSITLVDFRRTAHAGTGMAKAYESDVLINDHGIQWKSTISMNEPLRYKGYTFFQSSFIETPVGDRSVLSVVQNSGRAFPYIAGFAVCFGLFVHLLINGGRLLKKGKK